MFILDAREGHVSSLAFAPDAGTLYACHGHRGTHVWNLADHTSHPLIIGVGPVVGMFVLHPGGRWAFGLWHYGSTVTPMPHAFDLPVCTAYRFNTTLYHASAIAPVLDGTHLVTVGHSLWDEERPANPPCYRHYGWWMTEYGPKYEWHQDIPPNVSTKAVAALGSDQFATDETVAGAPRSMLSTTTRHEQVAIRHARDGASIAALDFPYSEMQQLLAAPDGTKLVARTGTELRVWDATNWAKPPTVVEGVYKNEMAPPAACFHPSGDYLLLANGGPSVLAYETRTWKAVRKWNWKGGALRAVAVSPDGTLAAAGGPRGAIVVWDLDL